MEFTGPPRPAAVVAPATGSVVAALLADGHGRRHRRHRYHRGVDPARAVRCRPGAGTLRRFRRAGQEVAGRAVDLYQQAVNGQLDLWLALADVLKVGWVSELTRRNATAVAELVAVYAGATHDLLRFTRPPAAPEGIAPRSAPSRDVARDWIGPKTPVTDHVGAIPIPKSRDWRSWAGCGMNPPPAASGAVDADQPSGGVDGDPAAVLHQETRAPAMKS